MKKYVLLLAFVIPLLLIACGGSTGGNTGGSASTPSKLTAQGIVNSMKAQGLSIGEVASYDQNTDPNGLLGRPNQYIDKANFRDTELGPDSQTLDNGGDGTVEIFNNANDAAARKAYVDNISKTSPMLGFYSYQSGKYLLRVVFAMSPDRAKTYQSAFLKAVAE